MHHHSCMGIMLKSALVNVIRCLDLQAFRFSILIVSIINRIRLVILHCPVDKHNLSFTSLRLIKRVLFFFLEQ